MLILAVSVTLAGLAILLFTTREPATVSLSWPQRLAGEVEIQTFDAQGTTYDFEAAARQVRLPGGGDLVRAVVAIDPSQCAVLASHLAGSCASGFTAASLSFDLQEPAQIDLFNAPNGETSIAFSSDGTSLTSLSLCHWSPSTALKLDQPLLLGDPIVSGKMDLPDGTVIDLVSAKDYSESDDVTITVGTQPTQECSPNYYVYPLPKTVELTDVADVRGASVETRAFRLTAPGALISVDKDERMLGSEDSVTIETQDDGWVGVSTWDGYGVPTPRDLYERTATTVYVNQLDLRPTLNDTAPWALPLVTMLLGVLLGGVATVLLAPVVPKRSLKWGRAGGDGGVAPGKRVTPADSAAREAWIAELTEDRARYADNLRSRGLSDSTVGSYTRQAASFIDWVARARSSRGR
jgi:hypothetical protein